MKTFGIISDIALLLLDRPVLYVYGHKHGLHIRSGSAHLLTSLQFVLHFFSSTVDLLVTLTNLMLPSCHHLCAASLMRNDNETTALCTHSIFYLLANFRSLPARPKLWIHESKIEISISRVESFLQTDSFILTLEFFLVIYELINDLHTSIKFTMKSNEN